MSAQQPGLACHQDDELWRLLDAALLTLREDPVAFGRSDEMRRATRINELAAASRLRSGRVFDWKEVLDDRGACVDRYLFVNHPGRGPAASILLWSSWGVPGVSATFRREAEENLSAWLRERVFDLGTPPGADWYTLGVFRGQVVTTRGEQAEEHDRVQTLAHELRAAAAEARLTSWDADDAQVGRAVVARLASVGGRTVAMLDQTPVAAVAAELRCLPAPRDKNGGRKQQAVAIGGEPGSPATQADQPQPHPPAPTARTPGLRAHRNGAPAIIAREAKKRAPQFVPYADLQIAIEKERKKPLQNIAEAVARAIEHHAPHLKRAKDPDGNAGVRWEG